MVIRCLKQNICKQKYKNMNFEKTCLKIGLGCLLKTPIFDPTFFQMSSENFLETLGPCSRYVKHPLNIVLYASKKIRVIRPFYKNIFAKNEKKNLIFTRFPWQDCSSKKSVPNKSQKVSSNYW